MEESILTSVKQALGVEAEYNVFDNDIMMHINSVFMILYQIGVGPSRPFRIEDEYNAWDEFIPMDDLRFGAVQSYVYAKVRMMFDPPSASAHKDALNQMISELEWRLNWEVELGLAGN
jgi:hypothetical protein